MDILTRPKQSGKTAEMVKRAINEEALLVVCDTDEQARIRREFNPAPEMITFSELFMHRNSSLKTKKIVIDNADMLIQSMTKTTVAAISMTAAANG